MQNIIEEYKLLAKQTFKEIDKTFSGKLDGKELHDEIQSLYLEASVKTKTIIDKLYALQHSNEDVKAIVEYMKEVSEQDINYVYEDTEGLFTQLIEETSK